MQAGQGNETIPHRLGRQGASRRRAFSLSIGERSLTTLTTCLVLGSVLAFGSVFVATLVPLALLTCVALYAATRSASLERRRAIPLAMVSCALLSLYCLVQALPLRSGWLMALAPHNAAVWQSVLRPFQQEAPSWVSLSLDPGATLRESLKWGVYGAAVFIGSVLGRKHGSRRISVILFVSACVVGVLTLAHGLLGASRVYGLYQPKFVPARWQMGPLLNPNCFAGYLNLGILAGAGLLIGRRPPASRWLIGLGMATLGACVLLSGSRAGVASLFLGAVLLGLCAYRVRKAKMPISEPRVLTFAALGAGGAALALAVLGGSRASWSLLQDTNTEKLQVVRATWPLIRDHFWFGTGRGAFEGAFQSYRLGAAGEVYSHPENFIAQWASEWGVPVAVALLIALGFALLPWRLRATRSTTAAGVWCGLIALLVHNLLDLSLELPGVATAAALAYGVLWGAAHTTRRSSESEVLLRVPAFVTPLILSATVLVVAFGWRSGSDDKLQISERYAGLNAQDVASREEFRGELRRAMLRHPAEPFFPRLGAALALRTGDKDAFWWISSALDRAVGSARTHYLLARMLARMGAKDQSLLELRFAATYEEGLHRQIARAALSLTQDFEQLKRAVPDGPAGAKLLASMASVAPTTAVDLRLACLREASRRDAHSDLVRYSLGQTLVGAIRSQAPPCKDAAREACALEANALAEALGRSRAAANDRRSELLRAQVDLALERPEQAFTRLQKACPGANELVECTKLQAVAAFRTRSEENMDLAVKALGALTCDTRKACADALAWLGAEAEAGKLYGRAVQLYQRALDEYPSDSVRRRLARAASAAGEYGRASAVLTGLVSRNPNDPALKSQLEAVRNRLLAEVPLK